MAGNRGGFQGQKTTHGLTGLRWEIFHTSNTPHPHLLQYAGSGISPWTRLAKKIFRVARDSDAAGCLDIYRPFIVDTAVSF